MWLVVGCGVGLVGCNSGFKADGGGGAVISSGGGAGEGGVSGAGVWLPEPARVRVYPSTRYVLESGEAYLEAAVEVQDAMGDAMKAGGELRLELFQAMYGSNPDQLLLVWPVPLRTEADQREHWSPVLRVYQFRLALTDLSPRQARTRLRATLRLPGGRSLVDEQAIRTDW